MHVVLLGDSIFDNGAYTSGGPDVITQLRHLLPTGWRATLGAVDGVTTNDLDPQLAAVPEDARHRVLSVGGNDALAHVDLLDRRSRSSARVLGELADAAEAFEKRYRKAVTSLLADKASLTVCTIYNGHFGDAAFQRLASTALTVFNDAILRVAFEHALTVIDLRLVCNEAKDYANPIEPSSHGGAKIARVIRKLIDSPGSCDGVARVYVASPAT